MLQDREEQIRKLEVSLVHPDMCAKRGHSGTPSLAPRLAVCQSAVNFFVRSFQGDVLDINEIFRELGTMIHEQGEVIGKL